MARGGHAARARRDLLLPALHALQSQSGWLSQAGLNHICKRLSIPPAEAHGVATFYALFSTEPRPPLVAHVCDDIVCRRVGATEVCAELERRLGPAGGAWSRSPCLGQCELAPAALVTRSGPEPAAVAVAPVTAEKMAGLLDGGLPSSGHLTAPGLLTDHGPLMAAGPPSAAGPLTASGPLTAAGPRQVAAARSVPQLGRPGLRLLARVGVVDPASLGDYLAHGGYQALRRALAIGKSAVIDEVTAAGLVGRGGAAFPTGRKWAAVAGQAAQPHYVVCNADESEPGTFKDRVLMEHDPFAIVEAMTIAAWAAGASHGYLYVRGEYPLAETRMRHAIAAARASGFLGADIDGSGFGFDIEVRRGAGAYICGEETALFASIEGRRGEPTNKPPFPVEVGLFGKPTAVNNVETLVNVPLILADDGAAEAYRQIGTEASSGPKLFCLSGNVERPGVYEVPFGLTLGELIDLAGWVPGGHALRAVLLGGAAGTFVGSDALDTPLTFEGTRAIGASLGSGVVMVFDETADLVGTLDRIAAFFRDESCGQCVPCRIGTVRQEELLGRLAGSDGRPDPTTVALLGELGQAMRDASICGLGQTASAAVESALRQPELLAP